MYLQCNQVECFMCWFYCPFLIICQQDWHGGPVRCHSEPAEWHGGPVRCHSESAGWHGGPWHVTVNQQNGISDQCNVTVNKQDGIKWHITVNQQDGIAVVCHSEPSVCHGQRWIQDGWLLDSYRYAFSTLDMYYTELCNEANVSHKQMSWVSVCVYNDKISLLEIKSP